jgi:hypothetical protein
MEPQNVRYALACRDLRLGRPKQQVPQAKAYRTFLVPEERPRLN